MNSIFKTVLLIVSLAITTVSQADVVLRDTKGKSTDFSALKGKWVLINYWAGWCESCVSEIPALNHFYKTNKNKVALYGVNFDNLPSNEQNTLIRKLHIQYPALAKNPAKDLHLSDISGVPVTFVFNPKGKLVKTLFGNQNSKSLNKLITAS